MDLFIRACRTCSTRLFFHTRPIKFLIYGVVVPVVDAKIPYFEERTATTTPLSNEIIG